MRLAQSLTALALTFTTAACGTPTSTAAPAPAAASAPAAVSAPTSPTPTTALSPLDRANAISRYLTVGKNAIDGKSWDDAIANFDAAIALDGDNARAFVGRAFAKMRKGGDTADADKDLATAIDLAKRDHDDASDKLRAGALYNRGLIAEDAGNKDRAQNFYRDSYDILPNKVVAQKLGLPAPP